MSAHLRQGWATLIQGTAAALPDGHRFEHQGPSPLDYSTSTSATPERLAIVKDDDTEGGPTEFSFGNHWVRQSRNPKTNRPYKTPRRVETPKAPPGTRAYVDHSVDTWGGKTEIKVHYMRTREDSLGQGHAQALMHHLIDSHPGADVNWGKVMTERMNGVREKVEAEHPDRTFRHKRHW